MILLGAMDLHCEHVRQKAAIFTLLVLVLLRMNVSLSFNIFTVFLIGLRTLFLQSFIYCLDIALKSTH
jgi:hypothetical protein